jgi:glycosyltransferase involved in cell wall biosynthesis
MSGPGVSVLLPVHDGARYLAEAIESVLAQTHPPLELIVVDDGSTDGSGDIARRHGARCLRQPRGGTAAARNAAVAAARGALLAHMDADDLWEPDKLARQVAALAADPALDAVSGHLVEFHSPDLPEEARRRLRPPRPRMPGHLLQAMLIRREAHARVGAFEPRWTVGQDMSWYMRAVDAGLRLRVLPDLVLRRRLHAGNKGLREAAHMHQRLQIVKAALERRRARA